MSTTYDELEEGAGRGDVPRAREDMNEEIRTCTRCRLSETRTNALCGEGDPNATFMLIAQAPGEHEDRVGRMFIGPSGRVLDELLILADIDRKGLYMTNLVKCMLPRNRRPRADEIESCGAYLEREIEIVDPRVIVTVGHYATRYVLGRYGIPLPTKSEFRSIYGRLLWTGERKVLPLQHPAAVLHGPPLWDVMSSNYRKIAILSKECKWYPACPMKRFHDHGHIDDEWVELYCRGDWERCIRYRMEERGEPHPDWMLPDGSVDEGLRKLSMGPAP